MRVTGMKSVDVLPKRRVCKTSQMIQETVIELIQAHIQNVLAIYAFGSRVTGHADSESDLDLAVLVAGYANPLELFDLSAKLSEITACSVDLLDLRAASTVMQYQIITSGVCWWRLDSQSSLYESFILSEKMTLDVSRAALMTDIRQRGSVYGG